MMAPRVLPGLSAQIGELSEPKQGVHIPQKHPRERHQTVISNHIFELFQQKQALVLINWLLSLPPKKIILLHN